MIPDTLSPILHQLLGLREGGAYIPAGEQEHPTAQGIVELPGETQGYLASARPLPCTPPYIISLRISLLSKNEGAGGGGRPGGHPQLVPNPLGPGCQ